MRRGDRVKVVSNDRGKCPDVGTIGTVVKCVVTSALIDFQGNEVWCRYSEIRKYDEMDSFLSEWKVGEMNG